MSVPIENWYLLPTPLQKEYGITFLQFSSGDLESHDYSKTSKPQQPLGGSVGNI